MVAEARWRVVPFPNRGLSVFFINEYVPNCTALEMGRTFKKKRGGVKLIRSNLILACGSVQRCVCVIFLYLDGTTPASAGPSPFHKPLTPSVWYKVPIIENVPRRNPLLCCTIVLLLQPWVVRWWSIHACTSTQQTLFSKAFIVHGLTCKRVLTTSNGQVMSVPVTPPALRCIQCYLGWLALKDKKLWGSEITYAPANKCTPVGTCFLCFFCSLLDSLWLIILCWNLFNSAAETWPGMVVAAHMMKIKFDETKITNSFFFQISFLCKAT